MNIDSYLYQLDVECFILQFNFISEPITWIIGGPDIYVDYGSTLNVTCVVSTRSKAPDYIIWSHFDRVCEILLYMINKSQDLCIKLRTNSNSFE